MPTHDHAGPAGHPVGRFSDRLAAAIARCGVPACVGIDPVLDKLPRDVTRREPDPVAAIAAYSQGVVDACAASGVIPVVKFQSGCFERYRSAGLAALERLIRHARAAGLLVILDAKRGDIGVTAEHYAAAAFDGPSGADAVTLSGYMGPDTLEPFLRYATPTHGRAVFVLVRTSNPGSDILQSRRLAEGPTVAEAVGAMVRSLGENHRSERGLSDVGAVVGATKSADGESLRKAMPDAIFLVPGIGAQGGAVRDVRPMLRPGKPRPEQGVLVTASRSVIYGFSPEDSDWVGGIRHAAAQFAHELGEL